MSGGGSNNAGNGADAAASIAWTREALPPVPPSASRFDAIALCIRALAAVLLHLTGLTGDAMVYAMAPARDRCVPLCTVDVGAFFLPVLYVVCVCVRMVYVCVGFMLC